MDSRSRRYYQSKDPHCNPHPGVTAAAGTTTLCEGCNRPVKAAHDNTTAAAG